MSVTQDEIELVIDYSKVVDKFFEKHNDVEEKILQNLENFYLEKQENIDIKKIKGTKLELHPKSWTQDWRCSFFVSKLTREDKIKIYERRKNGETIFKALGLNMSVAMNLFLKKCINENGIPFDLKLPNNETIEALEETNKILNGDIERKSYKNADELFEDLGV